MGVGTQATKLIIDYGFNILKLKKIYLNVRSENINAIKSYKKCGFIQTDISKNELNMEIINPIFNF
jgi:RimJ/RimL family protein N-acetyltransferase